MGASADCSSRSCSPKKQMLHEPVLYLSLFFKKHRRLYYDRLNKIRNDGGWKEWLDFFLEGVRDTANQAVQTAIDIDKLFRADKERMISGRASVSSAHLSLLSMKMAQESPSPKPFKSKRLHWLRGLDLNQRPLGYERLKLSVSIRNRARVVTLRPPWERLETLIGDLMGTEIAMCSSLPNDLTQ